MKINGRIVLQIVLAGGWISLSEFFRNEIMFKSFWIEHYKSLGLFFPSSMINNFGWLVWSVLFAISIYFISSKFDLFQTVFVAWTMGFVLMWITVGNLGVLPLELLPFAIPLSLLEVFVATIIIKYFRKKK